LATLILATLPELAWMAPEQLRVYPPRKCSQPGDVYSFAIILYEMCTRNEPYVNEPWYISLDGEDFKYNIIAQ
jgi:serine/threonine protein kinase